MLRHIISKSTTTSNWKKKIKNDKRIDFIKLNTSHLLLKVTSESWINRLIAKEFLYKILDQKLAIYGSYFYTWPSFWKLTRRKPSLPQLARFELMTRVPESVVAFAASSFIWEMTLNTGAAHRVDQRMWRAFTICTFLFRAEHQMQPHISSPSQVQQLSVHSTASCV